ncbi:glycosyltransferase involved in cell wall biosynthesis [Ruminiclostridium sufflavum DSM 19573]|uniref:Glycosyltransferase involved in cell wall biosynthesis n=1 Tax=Ruminiclostridium sufflavum DSM 19573 TaxID=1121337 RepID=A0A318XN30_9FIRM|nr:glycosyltransferase family 2 protein [Ruminiclostridium sufflavum]PYG88201.1 glycosyltransferase involved in cell wall biosynthesis [Ruminiclostridium sufflavum DSM 19573]
MSSSPLISVIIPMYNTVKYIKQTVESVLAQTYSSFEVIIVDDGSTDGSGEIVKTLMLKDSRIKYIFQSNQGVSAARNNAIVHSQGEYLAFLDSDDLWLPDKLEKQVCRLSAAGMDGCYCGYQYFCEASKGDRFPRRYFEGKILLEVIKEKVLVWTSTVVIKRAVVVSNAIAFRTGLNWAEDMDFFCRLIYKCNFCCVKEVLALYRQRPNSLSASPDRLPEIQLWKEFMQWVKAAPSSDLYNKQDIERAIYSYRLPSIAISCLYQRLSNGAKPEEDFFRRAPLQLVFAYRLSLSEPGLKLFIKKLLIRFRYGYKSD